jgi:amino acid permease
MLTTSTVILNLMLAELTLRTKKDHQMPGYSSTYLGKNIGTITFVIDVISGYATQLAYIIGLGQVLFALLGGSPLLWSLLTFFCVGILVYNGLETIKLFELVLTICIFVIVFILAMTLAPHISVLNFDYVNINHVGLPYGVIMFALAGHTAIPSIRRLLVGKEKEFPRVILIAYALVFIVYATFMYAVLGVTGQETTEVATIALGKHVGPIMVVLGNLLAVFTISTCYLTNGISMRRIFQFDYKKSRIQSTALSITPALLLFLFGVRSFIVILGLVGGIILGLQSIFVVLCFWQARKKGSRKPEFSLGRLHITGILLLTVFIVGAMLTLLNP